MTINFMNGEGIKFNDKVIPICNENGFNSSLLTTWTALKDKRLQEIFVDFQTSGQEAFHW